MPVLLQQPTTPAQTTEAAAVPTTAIIGAVLAGVVALLLAGAFVRHKRLMWSLLKTPAHDFGLSTVPAVDHWPGPAFPPALHNTSPLPSIPHQAEPSSVSVPSPSKDHLPCTSSAQSSNRSLESHHVQSADSINASRPIVAKPVIAAVPPRPQDLGPPYQFPKVAFEGGGDTR